MAILFPEMAARYRIELKILIVINFVINPTRNLAFCISYDCSQLTQLLYKTPVKVPPFILYLDKRWTKIRTGTRWPKYRFDLFELGRVELAAQATGIFIQFGHISIG